MRNSGYVDVSPGKRYKCFLFAFYFRLPLLLFFLDALHVICVFESICPTESSRKKIKRTRQLQDHLHKKSGNEYVLRCAFKPASRTSDFYVQSYTQIKGCYSQHTSKSKIGPRAKLINSECYWLLQSDVGRPFSVSSCATPPGTFRS